VRCDFADSRLHSYFDGELSSLGAAEFKRHLGHCPDCSGELVDLDLLSGVLQLSQLYEAAPASLRRKIREDMQPSERTTSASKPLLWHWLAAVAALLLVALTVWRFSAELRSDDYQAEFAGEIVDAHVRSLQPGHTTDIASADEYAVKGWFDGKLQFAVPVSDFAKEGFALQGGRLDTIEGRSVAALVYTREGNLFNVFIWSTRESDTPPRTGSRRGFHWVDWRKGKMEYCAVSDADPGDLEQLQQLINSFT
jgi:anti-sigma factor RsiW